MLLRNILLILATVIFLAIVYGFLQLHYFVRISGRLVEESCVYEQSPPKAIMKILVMGDSTAVGTGARNPANTVAGRLGREFPKAQIINRAENGMKTEQLLDRLDEFLQDEEYDLVVIHIGANDVLHLKNLDKTKRNMSKIIDKSLTSTHNLALFTSGNIGNAKLIPWFARTLMSQRSKELRDFGLFLESKRDNVMYIDLYHKEVDIPDSQFYAEDKLHLSDKGYGLWYRELKTVLKEHTGLY